MSNRIKVGDFVALREQSVWHCENVIGIVRRIVDQKDIDDNYIKVADKDSWVVKLITSLMEARKAGRDS